MQLGLPGSRHTPGLVTPEPLESAFGLLASVCQEQ
jgi:hypothetical protein